jgi:adenylyltransferase/sulfurtransferase
MLISDWGEAGQQRLKAATAFIAGAGGLGSPVAFTLAMAGVGHLRICDDDTPERSNLNRQFLHDESRIGMNKAESARLTLARVNPHVTVDALADHLDDGSVDRLAGDADIILDCMDNLPARHVLNRCAARKGIPLVHGAVWGTEGRVTFIHVPHTPCLACFLEGTPPPEVFPIVGATSAITGCMQAMEAIKYLTGAGTTLRNRLLIGDYMEMRFVELRLRRYPACPVCSGSAGGHAGGKRRGQPNL